MSKVVCIQQHAAADLTESPHCKDARTIIHMVKLRMSSTGHS